MLTEKFVSAGTGLLLNDNKFSVNFGSTTGTVAKGDEFNALRTLFNSMFELDVNDNIKTTKNLYSTGEIAAYGVGDGLEGGNTGGVSYDRLDEWFEYDAEKAGWVLSAKLGKNLLDKSNAIEQDLDNKYNELKNTEGDKHYEIQINMPSKDWEVQHNLNKNPSVTIINNDNQVVIGDVVYLDKNNLTVSFSAEFTGKVICN